MQRLEKEETGGAGVEDGETLLQVSPESWDFV